MRYGDGSFTAQVVAALLDQSDEFRSVWDRQEAGLRFPPDKHFDHPEVGGLELYFMGRQLLEAPAGSRPSS